MSAHVFVVQDRPGLDGLREEWRELLEGSAADSPFLTWEWLSAWWRHLGGGRTLHVIAVRSGPTLLAIVPLSLAAGGPAGFTRLEFLGTGTVASDYLDVIARAGREGEVLEALLGYFRTHRVALQLDHVRTPGALAECLAGRLSGAGWTARSRSIGVCPIMKLEGHTWDSLLGTLGSSHRANVRRRIRAMGAMNMRFDLVVDEAQRAEAFPALIALHNQRWGDRGGTAFHDDASRRFHDEATRLALERGWLRMYVLRINDAIAAVQYLLAFRGRFYFYQHGYDAQYSSQSVGLVSFALAIRAAIEEGASEFDMLWGDESYKHLWAHGARELACLDLFPPGAGGLLHRQASDANRALRSLARQVLDRARRGADDT